MVCNRCIKVVRKELEKLNLYPEAINLGEVVLLEPLDEIDREKIRSALKIHGFEVLDERKAWIIERIKNTIVEFIHHRNQADNPYKFSYLIGERLGMDYSYLSDLFSSAQGVTIEQYIILQRVERAKELLVYDELSLQEIARDLGYSSVSHFSNQFKKATGLSPSYYKRLKNKKRQPLDEI